MTVLRPFAGVLLMLVAFLQILFAVGYLAEDMLSVLWQAPVGPGRPANAYALVLLLTAPALMATGLLAFRGLRRGWVRAGCTAGVAVGVLGYFFHGPPALALVTGFAGLGLCTVTLSPFPPPPEPVEEEGPVPESGSEPPSATRESDIGDRLLLTVIVVSLCGLAVGVIWTFLAA